MPQIECGDANTLIDSLLARIPQSGALCVTFADPFGLHLDFDTVRKVASRNSDLIILLADNMDALRNWATYYYNNPRSSLDRFMGEQGWRKLLEETPSDRQATALRDRSQERLRSLGYSHFDREIFQNSKGSDIYSLHYASRHPLGLAFWRKASEVDEGGQRTLQFNG
jgi:three-Cys-motif partner protein